MTTSNAKHWQDPQAADTVPTLDVEQDPRPIACCLYAIDYDAFDHEAIYAANTAEQALAAFRRDWQSTFVRAIRCVPGGEKFDMGAEGELTAAELLRERPRVGALVVCDGAYC